MKLYKACLQGNERAADTWLRSKWVQHNLSSTPRAFNHIKFTALKNTLLHAACSSGSLNIARRLRSYGCDVNLTNRQRRTPLHYAVHSGNVRLVEHLLEARANVNAADEAGLTPLHVALLKAGEQDDQGAVLALVKGGARLLTDRHDTTPLDLACEAGNLTTVRTLLTTGRFVDSTDSHVRTLFLMLKRQDLPVALELYNNIGDLSVRSEVLRSVQRYAEDGGEDLEGEVWKTIRVLESDRDKVFIDVGYLQGKLGTATD